MWYTGIARFTKQPVQSATGLRACKMQRAQMQFFKPEDWLTGREALLEAGRADLVGSGCDCLIPAQSPKEALEARRRRASDPDRYHAVANPSHGEKPGERGLRSHGKKRACRPGRRSQQRQQGKREERGEGDQG